MVTEDEGRRALRVSSRDEHSTIAKEIHVDLDKTPILEWSWKTVELPAGADVRKRATSDLTAHDDAHVRTISTASRGVKRATQVADRVGPVALHRDGDHVEAAARVIEPARAEIVLGEADQAAALVP